MATLKVFNPCGLPPRHEFAHARRLADLNGKTIGEISSGFWQYDRAFPLIRRLLKERFPGVTFVPYTDLPNGSHAIDVDNIGEVVAAMGCDAAIGGPSGSGSNAMTVGRSLARIEKKGIPTFSIITTGHAGVAKTAFLGMGFSEAASCYEFPARTFLPGSDLADLAGNIDKVVDGLTTWKPPANGAAGCSLDMVAVSGRDYREASDRVNSLFLTNNWGDGLPLLPPTEERVEWVLSGTGLPRNTNIGKVLTRGGLATVESLAISLAMAGGRPEYLPILIAAMRGIVDPLMRHQMMQTVEGSVCPVVIVNGPVAKQIRLNWGYGCLGPDPAHPAGASIGRAIRLLLQNVGGAVPGSGNMSVYGGPSRYTNYVFAEDEGGLPPDWKPLHVERGYAAGSNVVTVYAVAGIVQVNNPKVSTEKVAIPSLNRFARIMAADYGNVFSSANDDKAPGIALIPPGTARGLSALGWSKDRVKEYLWEHSKIPWSVVESDYYVREHTSLADCSRQPGEWPLLPEGEDWPIAPSPRNIMIVVAGGGEQSQMAMWMRVGCCPYAPVSVSVELPSNWSDLLKKGEEDSGSLMVS